MKYLDENGLLYVVQKIKTWLNGKVDKVDGKGLSTNDYTTDDKNKLAGLKNYTLPTASATTLGGIKVGSGLAINSGVLSATGGGTADSVDWSNVQNRPTKVSEFTNDANYITQSAADTKYCTNAAADEMYDSLETYANLMNTNYYTKNDIEGKGYQTASDVNAIVENVVGAAPDALDTLKEIADALNNDPDFAATITAELAKKVNTADLVAITNAEIDTICA